jgi:hypothetical protein
MPRWRTNEKQPATPATRHARPESSRSSVSVVRCAPLRQLRGDGLRH